MISVDLREETPHRPRADRHVNVLEIRRNSEAVARFPIEAYERITEAELDEERCGAFYRSGIGEKDCSRAECMHSRRLDA